MEDLFFEQAVIEKLKFYVYAFNDPCENGKIFYIGKGTGNRVFDHFRQAKSGKESDKLKKIEEIQSRGEEVEIHIIKHGLDESSAFLLESVLIDFIGLPNLTNEVGGHDSEYTGMMKIKDIKNKYCAEYANIEEAGLLIMVNRTADPNKLDDFNYLYNITRKSWVVGKRREKAEYAFCVYRGIIRTVFKINSWEPSEVKRWAFNGEIADATICDKYCNKKINLEISKKGAANPIKYVNC